MTTGCISAPLKYSLSICLSVCLLALGEPRLYVNYHLIVAQCSWECFWGVQFAHIFHYVSIFLSTLQATTTVAFLCVQFLQLSVVH